MTNYSKILPKRNVYVIKNCQQKKPINEMGAMTSCLYCFIKLRSDKLYLHESRCIMKKLALETFTEKEIKPEHAKNRLAVRNIKSRDAEFLSYTELKQLMTIFTALTIYSGLEANECTTDKQTKGEQTENRREERRNTEPRDAEVLSYSELKNWMTMFTALSIYCGSEENDCLKVSKSTDGINKYSEMIKTNPEDPKMYFIRAAYYTKLGAMYEGLRDLDKCLMIDPKFSKGYIRKGAILFFMKEIEKAFETYQEGLKYDPKNPKLLEGLRRCKEVPSNANVTEGVWIGSHEESSHVEQDAETNQC